MSCLAAKDYKLLLDLIDIIYSIKDRNAMLHAVCKGLEPLVPMSSAVFFGLNLEDGVAANDVSHNSSTVAADPIHLPADTKSTNAVTLESHFLYQCRLTELKDYAGYYASLDPFSWGGCWEKTRNEAKTYSDYIPLKRHKETEFARDFLSRVPMIDCMGAVLGAYGHTLGVWGLHRQARDSNFNARDKEVLNRILPHLARTLLDMHHAQPTLGVILLDENHCPVYMDDIAARVTRERSAQELLEAAAARQTVRTQTGTYVINLIKIRGDKEILLFLSGVENTIPLRSRLSAFNLTPRQQEIVLYVLQGLSNQEIAERLFISLQTVKDHLHDIYKRMQVISRCDLMARVLSS